MKLMKNPSQTEKAQLLEHLRAQESFSGMCNENVASLLRPGDLEEMESRVAEHCAGILEALGIDTERDHNTQDTAKRMAKMYVREVCAGRFEPPPSATDFPNVSNLDEIVIVGPTTVRSMCAHHFCPIEGKAIVAVIPDGRIVGLSKFARLTNWVMARPQIQEEATVQLADIISRAINPRGLGLVIRARHTCMSWRGVKESNSFATTSVTRGIFRDDPRARMEFLELIKGGI